MDQDTVSTGRPRYVMVQQTLSEEIRSGAHVPGQRFLTEREVCERFGVSRTTAVRALSDLALQGLVVRQPGRGAFVSDMTGSGLTGTGRRQPLGLVCTNTSESAPIVRGISSITRERGYELLLFESEGSSAVEAQDLQRARTAGVAGMIIWPVNGYANLAQIAAIRRDGIPIVMVDRYYPMLATDAVLPDNIGLACRVTEHLVRQGHRRIAVIGAVETLTTSMYERLAGFRTALRAHDIAFEPELMSPIPYLALPSHERRSLLAAWFASPSPPTALLAINGPAYTTAVADLLELGRGLDSVVLACMDDMIAEGWLSYAAVTARIPFYEMGRAATRLLIDRIDHGEQQPLRHVILPVEVTAAL